jgi:hypothetical protein
MEVKLHLRPHHLKVLSSITTNISAGLILSLLTIKNLQTFIATMVLVVYTVTLSATIEKKLEEIK